WLLIGLPTAAILVVGAVFVITGGALSAALPVRLTPATMVSPMRAGAVLVASGYVVAQRKAAVASKCTGRFVYLGVGVGDRRRRGGGGAARRERLLQECRGHDRRPRLAPGRGRRCRIEPRSHQRGAARGDRAGRLSRRAVPGGRGQDRADRRSRQSDRAGQSRLPLL